MQRNKATFPIDRHLQADIKQRMLNWAKRFSILLFLDSNSYPSAYPGYECLLAAGNVPHEGIDALTDISNLDAVHSGIQDWLFGHLCYDYKNVIEPRLTSGHRAKTGFPVFRFFIPQVVCHANRDFSELTIETFEDPELVFADIMRCDAGFTADPVPHIRFTPVVSHDTYVATIETLRNHIGRGDCYEINYCTEAFSEGTDIDPLLAFKKLNHLSPSPFAAFYRLNDSYLLCSSPERFMMRRGQQIVSQPIKGTARRDADPAADHSARESLRNNIKEQAENVMIVDLVRNDLARCCLTGSVQVDELFGVYTFPQVHQLISTVSGTLKPGAGAGEAIRCTFPMGSMTGAPKYKVMQMTELYEASRRELFSGTVGYITPSGDFDFNVVIRSLFYEAGTACLSYQTGGAITFDSDPEKEWEEMRLKAWAMERVFLGK